MTSYALIGDSQGVGLSDPLSALISVVSSGPVVGATTAGEVRDQLPAALQSTADTVLVVTGGNDDPLSPAAFARLVATTRAAGKGLVVVGPVYALTSDAPRHDAARAALAAAAAQAGVPFIDAYPLTRDLARTTNVHLGPGYPTYAARLAAALRGGGGGRAVVLALGLGLALLASRLR